MKIISILYSLLIHILCHAIVLSMFSEYQLHKELSHFVKDDFLSHKFNILRFPKTSYGKRLTDYAALP